MEFDENIEQFNKPIINEKNYLPSNHKIFIKYSSLPYQKYSFELLETLCNKSSFENKAKILHKSIHFLLEFLFITENNILISNYDLIILVSFYLGIKTCENQNRIPNLQKLKNIYIEKFGRIENTEIKKAEIIFIKILEYKINFMTAYDYLCYFFKNMKEMMNLPKNNLELLIKENTLEYCVQNPITVIEECLAKAEQNKVLRSNNLIKRRTFHTHQKRKNLSYIDIVINNTKSGNIKNKEDSPSTSISSGYYNNNHSNEANNLNFYNSNNNSNINLKIKTPLKNVKYSNIGISLIKTNLDNYISNKSIYLNTDNSTQKNYTYCKKIALKNSINKNEKKIYNRITCFNARDKNLLRTDVSKFRTRINYSNIFVDSLEDVNNNYNQNISSHVYFKKEQSKGCFTSYKKKEFDIKYSCYSGMTKINNKDEDLTQCPLKKRLFLGEND